MWVCEFQENQLHQGVFLADALSLICSDLVARGIDLPTTSHVVSYDVPLDMRKYVHRVGRTARAGREGTAWTLVEKQEALRFKGWLKAAGHDKNVKKVKVKEEDLEPYQESYKVSLLQQSALTYRSLWIVSASDIAMPDEALQLTECQEARGATEQAGTDILCMYHSLYFSHRSSPLTSFSGWQPAPLSPE